MLNIAKKVFLLPVSAFSISVHFALAEPNTNVTSNWQTAPLPADLGSISANIQFLDFKLGMTLDEVESVLSKNPRYTNQGYGASQPITWYEENVSGYYSKVSFPKFDHVMGIQIASDGAHSDMLYLFFLPDPENRRVYAMNRRVMTDNKTIGREKFWSAVSERLGTPNIYKGRQSGGSFSVVNIADYSWNSTGEVSGDPSCKWGNPVSANGGVAFDVQPYNLTHLDFVRGWRDQGCSAVAVVSEAGYSGTEAIYSYSMVAYAVDLYMNSLQTNNSALENAFSAIREEIATYKSGEGKESPDL